MHRGFDAGTDNLLAEFDYTVRDDGRRSGAVEKYFDDGGTTPFEQNTFAWSYDDLGRLIGEVLDSSDNTMDYTDTFEWDVVGNRLETSRDWGDVANDDYTTTYQYDANDRLTIETKVEGSSTTASTYSYDHTQQMGKSVVTDGVPTSNQVFEYDLQGRMAGVTNQTLDSGGNVVGVQTTEYEYDTAGSRVVATNTVDADNDGTPESVTRTEYLTDANNPTGYSQVIEETEFDDQGNAVKKIVYTIGHDQISQSVQTWNSSSGLWSPASSLFFGYDGHGSVRVLYDAMAAIVTSATNNVLQLFHFDAHGNLLNMQAVEALTSYLYSGEAFDSNIGQQYLRARWYDATTGRFNRLDPFFGNLTDPQSLHKYLYVHGDPVNGIDPTGNQRFLASVGSVLGSIGRFLGRLPFPTGFTLIRSFGTRLGASTIGGVISVALWRVGFGVAFGAFDQALTNHYLIPLIKEMKSLSKELSFAAALSTKMNVRKMKLDSFIRDIEEFRAYRWIENFLMRPLVYNQLGGLFGAVMMYQGYSGVLALAAQAEEHAATLIPDFLGSLDPVTKVAATRFLEVNETTELEFRFDKNQEVLAKLVGFDLNPTEDLAYLRKMIKAIKQGKLKEAKRHLNDFAVNANTYGTLTITPRPSWY